MTLFFAGAPGEAWSRTTAACGSASAGSASPCTGGRPSISGRWANVCPHFQQRLTAPINSSPHFEHRTVIVVSLRNHQSTAQLARRQSGLGGGGLHAAPFRRIAEVRVRSEDLAKCYRNADLRDPVKFQARKRQACGAGCGRLKSHKSLHFKQLQRLSQDF
jgi:hypothetical protein